MTSKTWHSIANDVDQSITSGVDDNVHAGFLIINPLLPVDLAVHGSHLQLRKLSCSEQGETRRHNPPRATIGTQRSSGPQLFIIVNIMTAEPQSIPVVDFAGWSPTAPLEQRRAIAQKLIHACQTVGFVYITNHHLSSDRLAQAFEWSKKLFDLKHEQKMLAPHPSGFTVHRGYSWPGLEKVSNAMGNEEDKEELAKTLRQISDVKVPPIIESH